MKRGRVGRILGASAVTALLLALGAGAGLAQAQAPRERLEAARTLVRNGEYDSAMVRLNAVFQDTRTTPAERSRAFLYQAAVLFMQENMAVSSQSRAMLRQALQADSSVRVDDELNTDVPGLLEPFEALRRELYPPVAVLRPDAAAAPAVAAAPLLLDFQVSRDTTLSGPQEGLPVMPLPSRPARTVLTVRAPGDQSVLWRDSLRSGESRPILWLPRGADGRPLPDGVYAFDLTGVDEAGILATPVEWRMRLTALAPVTQSAPRSLAESALLPETLQVRHRSMATLLAGAGLGAAAAFIPTALGRAEVNKGLTGDGTAYVVAGSVTVAGLIGFLNGRRAEYSAANARQNDSLRSQYEERLRAVNQANDLARRQPPIRLVREGSPNR